MVPAQTIIQTAVEQGASAIGLSGLITPSLNEMVNVAAEMQRLDLDIPLMIGGATTSKAHTAVKIEPAYDNASTVYVTDASRAVNTAAAILGDTGSSFAQQLRTEYETVRNRVNARRQKRTFLHLADARANYQPINWNTYIAPKPNQLGVHTIEPSLDDLIAYIDWTPFFMTWELAGKYPKILDDDVVGEAARSLFADAQEMLQKLVAEGELQAKGVYGFWPANRKDSDDIAIYADDSRAQETSILHHLRQQTPKPDDSAPNFCLADYIAPTGQPDYIGGFAITAGLNIDTVLAKYVNDDYSSILIKALADRLAEAFAEYLHARVRREFWGYAADEKLDNEQMIGEGYSGIRPAPGYPACPEHSEKVTLFRLLDATASTGIELTDSFAMSPAAAVSGWYFAHPDSRYFGVGKIDKDQLTDYAARKGISNDDAQMLLRPMLD